MSGFPSGRRLKGCAGACAPRPRPPPGTCAESKTGMMTRAPATPMIASRRARLFVEPGCVFFVYMTLVLIKLGVFSGVAVERDSDRPGSREDFGIFDGRLVGHGVGRRFGVALDDMQPFTVEVTRRVEPGGGLVVRHIDDKGVA